MHFGPFMSAEWDLHTRAETREIPPPLFNSILPFLKGTKRKEREREREREKRTDVRSGSRSIYVFKARERVT